MVREIVLYGSPVLRAKCARVEEIDDSHHELAKDMVETMREAHGVGLAAPQVDIPIRMAVVDVSHDPECITYLRVDGEEADLADWMPLVFVNPKLEFGKARERYEEGCLSIPDLRAEVRRPADVCARLELLDGRTITVETDGLLARAIQHETDHLNGILFIDRLSAAGKLSARRRLRKLQDEWG